MDDMTRWKAAHANVKVVLADRPLPGGDPWSQVGWGWIFKAWFRSWADAGAARDAIRREDRDATSWGRKVRVPIATGHEGRDLADVVLARWPDARIQIRND